MTAVTDATETSEGGDASDAAPADAPPRRPQFLRRLGPHIRAQRFALTAAAVLAFVSVAIQVATPAVASAAIDAAVAGDRGDLDRLTVILALLGLGRFVFGGSLRYLLFRTAYAIEADLRDRVYRHLTRLSFSFYDRTQGGDVISRANSDIRSIQIYLAFAPLVLSSVFVFVFAFAYMLTIDVWLTVVALSTLPGVYLSAQRLRDRVFPLTWVTQARMAELAGRVDENINGVRVVKSFAAEADQITAVARTARRIRWATTETILYRARYNPLIEALPRVGTGLVLLYGGWLAIDGTVSVGTLFAFSAYVILLQLPFRLLGFLLLQGERANAAADRIFEILDEEPEIVDAPDAVAVPSMRGEVRFDDVTFVYPSAPSSGSAGDARAAVLSHFDLTIEPGETIAIVGRTGSGKSTIPRLIGRFYDVTDGAVLVDGTDVGRLRVADLRRGIAMVLDDPFLFSDSLHANIAYGRPDAGRDRVERAARAAQAHEFISALPKGYDTVVGERGYTLSGGQRQRIAIARALLIDPAILVLDDATSAIDVEVEAAIHAALVGLLGRRTTIVIAHRLSTIALAQRVVLLDNGHIVADGSHEQLLADEPLYAEILADVTDDENGTVD
jgi:ATP-binding cassette subfamily B protein